MERHIDVPKRLSAVKVYFHSEIGDFVLEYAEHKKEYVLKGPYDTVLISWDTRELDDMKQANKEGLFKSISMGISQGIYIHYDKVNGINNWIHVPEGIEFLIGLTKEIKRNI